MITVKLGGIKYPLRFDMNIMAEVQKRIGNISNMPTLFDKYADTRWLLVMLINEGIYYNNYMHSTCTQGVDDDWEITPQELSEATESIVEAYSDGICGSNKQKQSEETTYYPDAEPDEINFSRLYFIAITLLGYSRREAGFMYLHELNDQYTEYMARKGMTLPDSADDIFGEGVM